LGICSGNDFAVQNTLLNKESLPTENGQNSALMRFEQRGSPTTVPEIKRACDVLKGIARRFVRE